MKLTIYELAAIVLAISVALCSSSAAQNQVAAITGGTMLNTNASDALFGIADCMNKYMHSLDSRSENLGRVGDQDARWRVVE
ncbi:hypothetical protein [Cupriavidus sp. CuC1]|uniref:hypothetical protein n=1 Tax=Cupriavidus sp. CuC1 TaxID=3373131 RepID=UPI0037D5E676